MNGFSRWRFTVTWIFALIVGLLDDARDRPRSLHASTIMLTLFCARNGINTLDLRLEQFNVECNVVMNVPKKRENMGEIQEASILSRQHCVDVTFHSLITLNSFTLSDSVFLVLWLRKRISCICSQLLSLDREFLERDLCICNIVIKHYLALLVEI